MEILDFEPEMVEGLASLYNKATEKVPHCQPASPDQFRELAQVLGLETGEDIRHEHIEVVREGSAITGFAHSGVAEPRKPGDEPYGIIRFLWYEPGHRRAGQLLLSSAERRLVEHGLATTAAFDQEHRYPFYHLSHAYLSQQLGHVQALLGMNGYQRSRGEIFMDWPLFEPALPNPVELPISLSYERPEGRGRLPGVVVRACLGDRVIGTCRSVSCGDFAESGLVQDWIFTNGLNVENEYQGLGLGRHLLTCALHEARDLGYRNASISTDWNNHRAFLFYTNFGYRVVDWTFELRRRRDS